MKQKLKKDQKKRPTLVPDILFRIAIKDNVTCKMCKLLLALCLSPLLCPSSELCQPCSGQKLRGKEHQGKNVTAAPGDDVSS